MLDVPAVMSVQEQEKPQGQLSHPQIPDPQNSEQNKMAVLSYCVWVYLFTVTTAETGSDCSD